MDCNKLDEELRRLDELSEIYKRRIAENEGVLEMMDAWDKPTPKGKPVTIKTWDGNEIRVDKEEWIKQAERIGLDMGAENIREMVRDGLENNRRPGVQKDGVSRRSINYAQFGPDEANQLAVMELLGAKRNQTKKGKKLNETFSEKVAKEELLEYAKYYGANPREVAAALTRGFKNIDKLPTYMVSVMKGRRETSRALADQLEEVAGLLEVGAVTDDVKQQLGNVMAWAQWFDQMDTQVSRRVGQALRSRQFNLDELDFLEISKDLDYDVFKPGSLASQVAEAIEKNDVYKLKQLATGKRVESRASAPGRPNWLNQVEILNTYRKDNLFTSIATWGVRNPSAVFMAFNYGLEDIVEGALRVGVKDGLAATGHANKMVWKGLGVAWHNARNAFLYGDQKFALKSMPEVTKEQGISLRQEQIDNMNSAWDAYFGPADASPLARAAHVTNPFQAGLSLLNVSNAGFRYVVGGLIEKNFGTDAAYYLSFRALSGFDEGLRKSAFDWKVNHEAYLRAAKEADEGADLEGMTRSAWIQKRSDEMADEAIFSGVMTDDDLARLRRREIGGGPGENITNDELRLKLFNDLHGVPNPASELAQIGMQRGDDITFTGKFTNPVQQGIQMMRTNPAVGWVLPVWRSPSNAIGTILNRDMATRLVRHGALEISQRTGKNRVSPEVMATSRARTIVTTALTMGTYALWESGIFSDGGSGSVDPAQRDREMRTRTPYSFNIGGGNDGEWGAKISTASIDFFDIMSLQADIFRAAQMGILMGGDLGVVLEKTMQAYQRLLGNKSSLKSLTDLMDFFQDPKGYGGARLAASMLSGVLPWSGLQGNIARAVRDPSERRQLDRRFFSADEAAAIGQDQLNPIVQFVRKVLDRAWSNTVLEPAVSPIREKDWMGGEIKRPLGLPVDQAIPFMPVLKPNDGTYRWLEKHGFGMKPRADGNGNVGSWAPSGADIGPLRGVKITMTNGEEDVYREAFRTLTGEADSALTLGGRVTRSEVIQALGGIDQYVEGNNFRDAMTALRMDPNYALMLTAPENNPSLVAQPDKSLGERLERSSIAREVYAPVQAIIDYYDAKGMMTMVSEQPGFVERLKGLTQQVDQRMKQGLEIGSPLGIGRQ